jgi:hypothetical protein
MTYFPASCNVPTGSHIDKENAPLKLQQTLPHRANLNLSPMKESLKLPNSNVAGTFDTRLESIWQKSDPTNGVLPISIVHSTTP